MPSAKDIEASELREWFRYDPDTGLIYRKKYTEAAARTTPLHLPVGTLQSCGHIKICFMYKKLYAHRLAWALYYGYWPMTLDHINRNGADNRIVNLREVTNRENSTNMRTNKNNRSGTPGVMFDRFAKRWKAYIKDFNKDIHLGYFSTVEDAIAARKEAELRYGYLKAHDQLKTGQAQCQI